MLEEMDTTTKVDSIELITRLMLILPAETSILSYPKLTNTMIPDRRAGRKNVRVYFLLFQEAGVLL